jgi:DNA-binding NtrC family response regulator
MFLQKYSEEYNEHRHISSRLLKTLCGHPFPGNVRELESIIRQAVVMSESDVIDDFIIDTIGAECYSPNMPATYSGNLFEKIGNFEKDQLKDALRLCKTTREMAKYLGISQSAVVKKLKKHGL